MAPLCVKKPVDSMYTILATSLIKNEEHCGHTYVFYLSLLMEMFIRSSVKMKIKRLLIKKLKIYLKNASRITPKKENLS